MARVRRCNSRCHNAKRPRCRCWCGGFFHGVNEVSNRALLNGLSDNPRALAKLLQEHSFKKGETAYIDQKKLPREEPKTREECLESKERLSAIDLNEIARLAHYEAQRDAWRKEKSHVR